MLAPASSPRVVRLLARDDADALRRLHQDVRLADRETPAERGDIFAWSAAVFRQSWYAGAFLDSRLVASLAVGTLALHLGGQYRSAAYVTEARVLPSCRGMGLLRELLGCLVATPAADADVVLVARRQDNQAAAHAVAMPSVLPGYREARLALDVLTLPKPTSAAATSAVTRFVGTPAPTPWSRPSQELRLTSGRAFASVPARGSVHVAATTHLRSAETGDSRWDVRGLSAPDAADAADLLDATARALGRSLRVALPANSALTGLLAPRASRRIACELRVLSRQGAGLTTDILTNPEVGVLDAALL